MMVTRLLELREVPTPGRRRRRARARVLPRVARAAGRAGGGTVIGRCAGTVIERTPSGEVLVEVGGVGYRVLVPMSAVPGLHPGAPRVPLHAPARARGRDGALRVPDARRARHVRGADRRDRRRPEARARDPLGAHAERAAALPRRRRPRRAHARARRRQAHRAAAARRAKSRLEVPDLDLRRCRARRQRARAEVREALTGLGYSTDEVRDVLGQLTEDGEVEDLLRDALRLLAGATRMRDELLSPAADPVEAAEETTLRPRRLDEFVGQPRLREHLEIMLGAAAQARAGRRPRAARGAARSRQDHARRHHRDRDGRAPPADERARARAGRRPRRDPHQPRRRRRAVHRRGPPPAPHRSKRCSIRRWRTSSSTSSSARARRRARSASTSRASRSSARRRAPASSPDRCATASASSPASTTTTPDDLAAILTRVAQILGVELDPEGRRRDRVARARHAAHREPLAQARARLRRGARRRSCRRPTTARDALALFEVDELGLDKVDRAMLTALCRRSPAGRSASARSRSRSVKRRRPSKTCTNRSCCSAGCSNARRAAGSRPPAAFEHLGLHAPERPGDAPGLFA